MTGLAGLYYGAAIVGVGWLVLQNVLGVLSHDGDASSGEHGAGVDGEAADAADAAVDAGLDADHGADLSAEGDGDAGTGGGLHVGAHDAGHAPHVGGHGHAAAHAHASGEPYVSPWKPLVLASSLGAFGATGSLLTWLRPEIGLITAPLAGVLGYGTGWAVWRILVFAARSQASGTESQDQFIGLQGRLSLGCSAQRPGEVLFETGRSIQQFTARPFHGDEEIPSGTTVTVMRIADGVAYVEPASRLGEGLVGAGLRTGAGPGPAREAAPRPAQEPGPGPAQEPDEQSDGRARERRTRRPVN